MNISPRKRLVLFWDYYGPYHYARFGGMLAAAKDSEFVVDGMELAGHSATYAWRREHAPEGVRMLTLFPGEVAEKVNAWKIFRAVRKHFLEEPAEAFFVPSYWPAYVMAATLAAKSCGVKVVIMAESHYASGRNDGFLVFVKRWLVGFYASALVGGSMQRSFFRYLGMPDGHILDGYDAVDNAYFRARADAARADAATWRETLQVPRRYILSLGRFVPKKNLPVLIRAYAQARQQGKLAGIHLLFVGSGTEKDSLDLLARQLGFVVGEIKAGGRMSPEVEMADYAVHFHPFTQIDKSPGYYALADCFVLPSRAEEWGLVVNEAMASGCPVVVSRSVGCSLDLVESGKTGFRFSPDNPNELAWYLDELCASPELRARMAQKARVRVDEWGPDRFGTNALEAARRAARPKIRDTNTDTGAEEVILLQTSFPDYRIPVYVGLSDAVGSRFQLYTGMEYFTPDIRTCTEFRPWIYIVKNNFLFGRRLLWQGGVLADLSAANVAILELNPRIITNWIILIMRWLWGRPTLLWGHAWGRAGGSSYRNLLRLLMMRLASGVVTYTHSQRRDLARILLNQRLFTAPNSLFARSDFEVTSADTNQLRMIMYVGRLNVAKKPALLLEGFILAVERLPPHIILCIIGDGDESIALRERVRSSGLEARVRLLGHVHNRKILQDYYQQAFCSVSPGYVGLSAIQSFSFGVPMIIADKEEHAPEIEACNAEINSIFFKSDDSRALADALVEAWESRSLWAAKREEIAHWTASRYSIDTMVAALADAIQAVKITR